MFTENLLSAWHCASPGDIKKCLPLGTHTHTYSRMLNPEKWLRLEGLLEFQGRNNCVQRARVVTKGKTPSPEERVAESLRELM